jgi:hypothetical protein
VACRDTLKDDGTESNSNAITLDLDLVLVKRLGVYLCLEQANNPNSRAMCARLLRHQLLSLAYLRVLGKEMDIVAQCMVVTKTD